MTKKDQRSVEETPKAKHTPGCECVVPPQACALHAAAPELLAALEKAAEWIAESEDFQRAMGWNKAADKDLEFVAQMRAAIAEARGT